MAEIGYTRSTDSRYRVPLKHSLVATHDEIPLVNQYHTMSGCGPISIRCIRLWLDNPSLEVYPTRNHITRSWPGYSAASPHIHTRTRSGAQVTPRHEAGRCSYARCCFRSCASGVIYREEVAVEHPYTNDTRAHHRGQNRNTWARALEGLRARMLSFPSQRCPAGRNVHIYGAVCGRNSTPPPTFNFHAYTTRVPYCAAHRTPRNSLANSYPART